MKESSPIPVILGQTASGKTSIGIELAKLIDGEIISVDSRKVYEGLPIGTATPAGVWKNGAYQVKGVPHHLISFLKPDQSYNAGDFAGQADQLIQDIQKRGKTPILVGGTGFYFKALQQGLPVLPRSDPKFRQEMDDLIQEKGLDHLRKKLETIDLDSFMSINEQDKHKTIRALEVYHLTGRPFSYYKAERKTAPAHRFVVMGLQYPKEELEKRIEERSEHMARSGMIEEAEAIMKKGFGPDCAALSSFGYREAVEVIQGKLPRKEFLPALIKGTKAYAKRQRTWFRTQVHPAWFTCEDPSQIAERMKAFCYTDRA